MKKKIIIIFVFIVLSIAGLWLYRQKQNAANMVDHSCKETIPGNPDSSVCNE